MREVRALVSVSVAMAVLLVIGCSTSDVTAPEERVSIQTIATAAKTARAQPVARGFAAALRSPELRASLLDAMRSSPWHEHKLVLQEFARLPEAGAFMRLAAAGAGMTESAFLALVARLPAMDVYFPSREHRLRWSGEAELLVGTTFDGDAPELFAYTTAGETRTLRLADGMPDVPLLLLQPAERKFGRAITAPRGSMAIEDPGELALLIEECDPETAIEPCDPGGGGGGGGGGSPTPGIYVTHFHGFDNDGWYGDLEMLFRSRAWHGDVPAYSAPSQMWAIPDWCELGQAVLTWPPHQNWNGTPRLITPGVHDGNIFDQSCGTGISPHGYYIEMFEEDGDIPNFEAHHWGTRFFSAHPVSGSTVAPWGAWVGVNEAYYGESGNTGIAPYKANLKTEYR